MTHFESSRTARTMGFNAAVNFNNHMEVFASDIENDPWAVQDIEERHRRIIIMTEYENSIRPKNPFNPGTIQEEKWNQGFIEDFIIDQL